ARPARTLPGRRPPPRWYRRGFASPGNRSAVRDGHTAPPLRHLRLEPSVPGRPRRQPDLPSNREGPPNARSQPTGTTFESTDEPLKEIRAKSVTGYTKSIRACEA